MGEDPKETQEIDLDQLAGLARRTIGLEEETDDGELPALRARIFALEVELRHARAELAIRDDVVEDVRRRLEMTALGEAAVRGQIDRTHATYRSVLHHLDVAVTICYSRSGALWMSRRALELSGATRHQGDEMSSPEDWLDMGELSQGGERLEARDTPLWRAMETGEPQLGHVLEAYGHRLRVDAYPVEHGGLRQAYAIWWPIEEAP